MKWSFQHKDIIIIHLVRYKAILEEQTGEIQKYAIVLNKNLKKMCNYSRVF